MWQPRLNMISPVIFAGALTIFCWGPAPVGPTLVTGPYAKNYHSKECKNRPRRQCFFVTLTNGSDKNTTSATSVGVGNY